MTGRSALRSCEDVDNTVLQYAEFKALATSDPRIKEKMEIDNEISRLTVLKSSWQSQKNDMQFKVSNSYPAKIAKAEKNIKIMEADIANYADNRPAVFSMDLNGRVHTERAKAAEHFMVMVRKVGKASGDSLDIGKYAGFNIRLVRSWSDGINIQLCGQRIYTAELGEAALGNITRIENLAERIEKQKDNEMQELESLQRQFEDATAELEIPFADEERLAELQKKKVELDLALEFREEVGGSVVSEDGRVPVLEQKLYNKLLLIAEPVLSNTACYMRFEADGFDDLVVKKNKEDDYSIAHHYKC